MILFRPQAQYDKDAVVILLTKDQTHARFKQELDNGEIFPVIENKKTFLFVGLGKADSLSLTQLRIHIRKALLSDYLKKTKTVEIIPHATDDATIHAIIEGVLIGTYVWISINPKTRQIKRLSKTGDHCRCC